MIIDVILTIISLIAFIVFGYRTLKDFGYNFTPKIPTPIGEFSKDNSVKSTLEISPFQKHIVSSANNNWDEEFFVYLVNNTDKTYYDINITSEFPDFAHVSFMPEGQDVVTVGSNSSGFSVGTDFMLVIKTPTGMNAIQTVINNIGPREKKKIKVVVSKENVDKEFDLNFKINSFSENPKPIYRK